MSQQLVQMLFQNTWIGQTEAGLRQFHPPRLRDGRGRHRGVTRGVSCSRDDIGQLSRWVTSRRTRSSSRGARAGARAASQPFSERVDWLSPILETVMWCSAEQGRQRCSPLTIGPPRRMRSRELRIWYAQDVISLLLSFANSANTLIEQCTVAGSAR